MWLGIVVLLSLYGFLRSQEQISLEECCTDGRERGQQMQDCTALPLISEFTMCRIAQEQCCLAVQERESCSQGIKLAKSQGSCEGLFSWGGCEGHAAKMCCNCCLLGQLAVEQGQGCDLDLSVVHQCGLVSRGCCLEGLSKGVDNSTQAAAKQRPASSGPSGKCEGTGQCPQHCTANGTCSCPNGYKAKPNGQDCEDINECLLGSHRCHLSERCINTEGSYRCQRVVSCGTGYELTDSNTCRDIDECTLGMHSCPAELECQNTQGSFRCLPLKQCDSGYIQDALGSCVDINECLSQEGPCGAGHVCVNTVGSYVCRKNSPSCGRGYHLSEDGSRCVDTDECMGTDGACAGHGCVNTVGSYRCECRPGYIFNSISKSCEDINECRHYPGRLCAHKCDNVLGSYQCSCTMGFRLASDGRNCEDINECESNPCSQECVNVYGSYQCYCRRGYQLSDVDGTTCEDIDECALPAGGHICAYRCHNTPGSFHCTCPESGYTLATNGRNCQDLDECVTGKHNCTETDNCFNIQGSFRCLSFDCPPNYRHAGEIHCERLPCNHSRECLALPVRILHYQLTFPTRIPVPSSVFRMGPAQSQPGDRVWLDITAGNQDALFATSGGAIVVERPVTQARDFLLTVRMKLLREGALSTYLAKISIFVSQDPFRLI